MPTSSSDLIQYPPKRAIKLRNRNCVYCGVRFGEGLESTEEHVIGRRFVPRGCFHGQWNLIVGACERCNREKADLEDDISAISMLPDLTGRHAIDDPRLAAEAVRKARGSRSRRSGKMVSESQEEIKLEQRFGGAKVTFTFTAPPQIEEWRIYRLAHHHFRAFFFFITYQEDTQLGGFVQGEFFPLITTRRADWGNPRMRWFAALVSDWDLRIHAIGADTFFKMIIRRHPGGKEVWAWAIEWNHSIRIIGFSGKEADLRDLTLEMPEVPYSVLHEEAERALHVRIDEPLEDADDDLFTVRVSDEIEALGG